MKSALLRLVLGFLGEFVASFVRNLQAARLDDPSLTAMLERVVRGVARTHPDWSGEQKRTFALTEAKMWALNAGRDVKDSLLNTLLELVVQRVKEQG